METAVLDVDQIERFRRDGVLIIPDFYAPESDLLPVQRAIYMLIGLVIQKYDLEIDRPEFSPEAFDAGFMDLIAVDRSYGSEIYDAVKQIPAFVRLVSSRRHEQLFRQLRPGSIPAIAAGGYGIRIDIPFEDRFRANWHQEYPAQLRSIDGVVYWTPLLRITPELGPVEFCLGSHRSGALPVVTRDASSPDKRGAYSLTLRDEAKLISQFERTAPDTAPGDLVVIDFLVLHASGVNRGARPRWTMQFRYFNFADPTGIQHGWSGSYAADVDFRDVHPELCAD